MTEIATHYRKIADGFTDRVRAVPADAWDRPAPPEGWVARDVVRHLVEWIPAFFDSYAGITLATGPSVDEDPLAAWLALDASIRNALDDPAIATHAFEMRGNRYTVEEAIAQFVRDDVFLHQWDLARATGGDERLDPDEVHRVYTGMLPYEAMLRESGQFGTRVDVPADSDEQTLLIAFIGRRP